VATQTAFNGTKLLNGGFTGAVFQIGANAGDSITINSIANSTAGSLGTQVTQKLVGADTITAITDFTAITSGTITLSASALSDKTFGAIASASSYQERAGQIVDAVNNAAGTTGVFAYINSANTITLQSEAYTAVFTLAGTALADAGVAAAGSTSSSVSGVTSLSVEQYGSAQTAIALVDKALTTINNTRATLGAVQSRFESAVASQQTTSENLAASRSRIQDADFASETANLAKAQILQQSGIAMLAQANAIPQNVLALLQ